MIQSYADYYRAIVGRVSEADASPERLAAAKAAAITARMLTDRGWVSKDWTPYRNRPCARYEKAFYGWDWDRHYSPILDHMYRLVNKTEGQEIFVTEPYSLRSDGIGLLAELCDAGWKVDIAEGWALHFPGRTIPIWISS